MENASKALLMAGGVLVAILVVSLGIYFSRIVAESIGEIYERMEQRKIAEFNQQFLEYKDTEVGIQDIVSLINLAKDSNDKNLLSGEEPPIDPKTDTSYYITVNIDILGDTVFDTAIAGKTDIIGKPCVLKNSERFSEDIINEIITEKMKNTLEMYNCEVNINSTTGYVNEVIISL